MKNSDRGLIIGGSDIAAVMGLSRWTSPLRLWAEKTDKIKIDELADSEAAEIGIELEEYVARKFAKKTGFKLRVDQRVFRHEDYPYMVAHIDRWICNEDAGFEAKTCSAWKLKEWDGLDIPNEYALQCNWYMGILGKSAWYIAALIGGQKFLWKRLEFNKSLFEKQVAAAKNFMEEFILKDLAPMAGALDQDTMCKMYPKSEPSLIDFRDLPIEDQINAWLEERAAGCVQKKEIETEIDEIEAKLKQQLTSSDTGETKFYRFTWKTQQRVYADSEKLKQDGIFDQYSKTSTSRVLRVTKKKQEN